MHIDYLYINETLLFPDSGTNALCCSQKQFHFVECTFIDTKVVTVVDRDDVCIRAILKILTRFCFTIRLGELDPTIVGVSIILHSSAMSETTN